MRPKYIPYILLYVASFILTGTFFFIQQNFHHGRSHHSIEVSNNHYNDYQNSEVNHRRNLTTQKIKNINHHYSTTQKSSYRVNQSSNSSSFSSTTESLIIQSSTLSLHKHVTKSLDELARDPILNEHVLFLNGARGCGTELLVLLMQKLQGQNGYIHYRLKGGRNADLEREEQVELVDKVTKLTRDKAVPLTFDRHIYFVNFTRFHAQSPTYLNMVRNPVDRLASRFYYKKALALKNKEKYSLEKIERRENLDEMLEQCVEKQNPECTFVNNQMYDHLIIPYFCGQEERCRLFNDEWALTTAKSNVERYYSVVGVLEELNATLEILESRHPYFFNRLEKSYYQNFLQHRINNDRSIKLKSDLRKRLENMFVTEYDFYEWIKQRLFRQLQTLYGNHNH